MALRQAVNDLPTVILLSADMEKHLRKFENSEAISEISDLETLDLQRAFLIHAGDKTFPLHRKVTAVSANRLLEDLR